MTIVSCCHGTYVRSGDGMWRYEWGPRVPGARDLLLGEVLALRDPQRLADPQRAPEATSEDLAWAGELFGISEPVEVHGHDGSRDLVVGLEAPELHAPLMMTVADIAEVAEVSKATVDSYRYRGYLPEPQLVKGRTPLWARPVIGHWLDTRPGSGWRTDVYGDREGFEPTRTLPISSARQARDRPSVGDRTPRSGAARNAG